MTAQPGNFAHSPGTEIPAPIPRAVITEGSRLEQLLSQRAAAQAEVEAAEQRLKLIDDGIKYAAAMACPGAPVVDIPGSQNWPPLRLRYHEGKIYVPVPALRSKYRAIYDELATRGKGWWQLHPVSGDGS